MRKMSASNISRIAAEELHAPAVNETGMKSTQPPTPAPDRDCNDSPTSVAISTAG
jgi:hypothetical protein